MTHMVITDLHLVFLEGLHGDELAFMMKVSSLSRSIRGRGHGLCYAWSEMVDDVGGHSVAARA